MSSYNPQSTNANINRFRSIFPQQQQCIYQSHLSGSETDVSTSNENLSNEDRYVIRHTARQEPQGQENLQVHSSNSNRNSQRESSSSYNTLIIHSLGEDTQWTGRNSGAKDSPDNLIYNSALGHPNTGSINVGVYDSTSGATKRLSQGSNCSMPGNQRLSSGPNNNVQEITDIPDDYLNQSSVLKHLAKEANSKTSVYEINNRNDALDDGGQSNQLHSPKQLYQNLMYHSSGGCNSSPTATMSKPKLPSPQPPQQLSTLNRPSSASSAQHSSHTGNKNTLSKSQPDLSRVAAAAAVADSNGEQYQHSSASVDVSAQLQQHYSAPVLLRNSSTATSASSSGAPASPGLPVYSLRYRRDVSMPRPRTRGRDMAFGDAEVLTCGGRLCGPDKAAGNDTTWSADMIDMLLKENSALKLEVENCYARIGKSQKLEQEVLKVHSAHEDLVASCERRERLERTARTKLQLECRRLQDTNRLLRDQLDMQQVQLLTSAASHAAANNQQSGDPSMGGSGSEDIAALQEFMRREMNKRDLLIAQFITQNKELGATKERQEIELTAQRATLQEQRTHIDILEGALTNAQGNVVRLEEECRKKQAYVERVNQLQRTLNAMQIANDRREQTERSLRLQLELELERTNTHQQTGGGAGGGSDASAGGKGASDLLQLHGAAGEEFVADLKKQLREREEKMMRLEGECSKWEQRYLEESALRQAAIDAASIPKDAKIAALEKTSQETEKIIAEARTDKIRHMDEAHAAQKKLADLESRLKDLESKLAERDAMIRVLNHKHSAAAATYHAAHASTASTASSGADPHHHHHLIDVLTGGGGGGSASFSSSGGDSSTFGAAAAFDATKKQLDSQIKEIDTQLDTQLLTKRALCCFPGFTNPIATARKGKLPKPLLASLTQQNHPTQQTQQKQMPSQQNSIIENANICDQRHRRESTPLTDQLIYNQNQNEIILLEKQGRSSQQQRMSDSNLPPSSLPRPPPRFGLPAKSPATTLRYNRLNSSDDCATTRRKKSPLEPADAPKQQSLIPSPSNRYTRLVSSDTSSSTVSLRKTSLSTNSSPRATRFDRDSTLSDNSASSLPVPGKVRFYSGPGSIVGASVGSLGTKRGSSLGREGKDVAAQFRIQF